MEQRIMDRWLAGLRRGELEELTRELAAWAGADVSARMIAGWPTPPASAAGQLSLVAVDVDTLRERLAVWQAFILAASRAARPQLDAWLSVLDHDAFRRLATQELAALAEESVRALRFDRDEGIAWGEEMLHGAARVGRAVRRFSPAEGNPAHQVLFAEEGWHGPVDRLYRETVAAIGASELGDGMLHHLAGLTESVQSLRPTLDAWTLAAEHFPREKLVAGIPVLRRYIDGRKHADATTLALLSWLASVSGEPDRVEAFVYTAEPFTLQDPGVVALVVATLREAGHDDEAMFWLGEGRRRFPSASVWATL